MTYVLVSNENKSFTIPKDSCSLLEMVNEITNEPCYNNEKIELINVNNKNLLKIIEFCNYYTQKEKMKIIPRPVDPEKMENNVQKWYSDFVNIPEIELVELAKSANYVYCKPLFNLCCAKVAFSIKKYKTETEINNMFGIDPNKLSEHELELINEHGVWTEKVI